jgi:N utilization substance protein B
VSPDEAPPNVGGRTRELLNEGGPETVLEQVWPLFASGPFPERRLGRALAFLILYESDLAHHAPEAIITRVLGPQEGDVSLAVPAAALRTASQYARELVEGVHTHQADIDALLQRRAAAWPLGQMSAVDRNILRVGLYEVLYARDKVPSKAAINEAVEIAKLFGSETSGKFVNGVLGRAVDEIASLQADAEASRAESHDETERK